MRGLTHAVFGIATGTVLSIEPSEYVPLIIGSLFPDIDEPTSTLGRLLPVGYFVKHRTVTHSLFALIIAFWINPLFGIGYLTHIFLDMLTPAGIQLFYPWEKKVGVKLIRTGSFMEFVFLMAICIFIYNQLSVSF